LLTERLELVKDGSEKCRTQTTLHNRGVKDLLSTVIDPNESIRPGVPDVRLFPFDRCIDSILPKSGQGIFQYGSVCPQLLVVHKRTLFTLCERMSIMNKSFLVLNVFTFSLRSRNVNRWPPIISCRYPSIS
jgi:hypothetical protein